MPVPRAVMVVPPVMPVPPMVLPTLIVPDVTEATVRVVEETPPVPPMKAVPSQVVVPIKSVILTMLALYFDWA